MKTAEEYYESLLIISKSITSYYYQLEELEHQSMQETLEYQTIFSTLYDEITKEDSILKEIANFGHLPRVKELLDKDLVNKHEPPIILRHGYANLFRLNSLIESMYNDEVLKYVYALKYDIGYLLLAMIEELICDEYYNDIKQDLISFKYSIIYCHVDLENDFLEHNLNTENIKLTAYKQRPFLPGYRYIDKAILVEETNRPFIYLENISEFSYSSIKKFNVIISILKILARLILCDEFVMNELYKELINLLEDDAYPTELKEEIQNMFNLLSVIQAKLGIQRN